MIGTDLAADIPDLVPARMVNEYTYCPRLFYLEWVQSRFADNADTVEGTYQHRNVDKPEGTVPLPGEGDLPSTGARSVMVSSTRMGLVGRIDVLEGKGGSVQPVDFKHGAAPDTPERSWEPERMQLCVLGLMLRDAGYRCGSGILFFVESRERVEVIFTDRLIERAQNMLDDLRNVARRDLPPPPLLRSPKCPRCSLVGICLPDEHNLLLARTERPPRRLIPSDGQGRPLYVTQPGSTVGISGGRFELTLKGERIRSVRMIDVSQVCVYGNVQVTTQALRECFAREIPVCYFSAGGWLQGIAEGLPSKHVELRRRQVVLASQGGLEVARTLIAGKIRNCRTLLRRNGRPAPSDVIESLARLAESATSAESAATLLGLEGTAARLYFQSLPTMLKAKAAMPGQPFAFDGRNRRPPADPVNCLLSYVYALLVKDLVATVWAVGLDPYVGIFHRPRFGRPALALDLAEEFRPLIGDSVVVNLINNGEIRPSDFVVRAGGVALTADGRRTVLASYERRLDVEVTHPVFRYKVSYRRVLEVQARILAAHMVGELPAYTAFTTR
jgi:CRISP-associated protein Cas1